jgi:3-hydroxybutyryl-CoA dehydratase
MNAYTFRELGVGMAHAFEAVVTPAMMRRFREDTGDDSPLHFDPEVARSRGFSDVVVYGMLAASFYSTLVGVHLPGRHALLHGINADFVKPVYTGVPLRVGGEVIQLVEAYRRIEIQASITTATGETLSKARIRVGLHE